MRIIMVDEPKALNFSRQYGQEPEEVKSGIFS